MSEQATARPSEPVVRAIGVQDVVDAVAAGLRDFRAAPVYGLFFGAVYTLGGMLVVLSAFVLDLSYLAYPLAGGFTLIGPFVAVGLYEVSRRRETGQPLSWRGVLGVVVAQRKRELAYMAFVTIFVLIIWMYQVRLLIALFLGLNPPGSVDAFLGMLVSTPEGLLFLLVGHVVGALLALVLFSITVVSFPLLLDRELDFVTAMITSVRSVTTSPVPMVGWAAVVVILLIVAMAPFFVGLLLVLPVLGHATWHLYRKLVAPVAEA
jgi:uncharacterized membrane protein